MSEEIIIKGEETLFEKKEDYIAIKHCSGCEKKIIQNHNGVYVKIMDWVNNQAIKFIEIVPNN
jgi:hypothetical protein